MVVPTIPDRTMGNLWRAVGVGALAGSHGPRVVAVVGDSLAWQAKSSIETALISAGYAGQVSADPGRALSPSWAQSEIGRDIRHSDVGIIVVETASNDAVEAARSAVAVVQWNDEARAHPSWFAPDSLHFAPGLPHDILSAVPPSPTAQNAGESAFGQAMVAGIEPCSAV
ncbi:MAG TPA: hypothetical protein VMD28_08815 [Acidimicrobiales bacterium]|nr:hypothetical protein [Acidimicrobiales bacterium]